MNYKILREIFSDNRFGIDTACCITNNQIEDMKTCLNISLPKGLVKFLKIFGSIKIKDDSIFSVHKNKLNNIEITKKYRELGLDINSLVLYRNSKKLYTIDTSFRGRNSIKLVIYNKSDLKILRYKLFDSFEKAFIEILKNILDKNSIDVAVKNKINVLKLKKMRKIATGLLIFMSIMFVCLRKYEDENLILSSLVAFAEASMIGALADWFAVVALFRYPLGLKWIPHTAIIRNNKNRIAVSLSNFVVNNFLNSRVVSEKLKNVDILNELSLILKNNSNDILIRANKIVPDVFDHIFTKDNVSILKEKMIKNNFKLYPFIGEMLDLLVSSGHHVPILKEVLTFVNIYINDNRDKTLKFIESLNKTLSLPVIRNVVYNNILKTIGRQIDDIENPNSEISNLLGYGIPKFVLKLKTSEELVEKGEFFKKEILESNSFDIIIKDLLEEIRNVLKTFDINTNVELKENVEGVFFSIINKINDNEKVNKNMNSFIKISVEKFIDQYKNNIEELISETAKKWKPDDMVKIIEIYVGADLQYIRINGTIIGGIVGVIINFISKINIF